MLAKAFIDTNIVIYALSLIVATALEAGCATLYTEDLHHGQVIEGQMTVTNPFSV
ncbi:MAG: hypothetical protein Q8O31_06435 [Rhodocyclaceae bacterium]|nr:hypothetical protein [Rhodocyclaceae bacterium]